MHLSSQYLRYNKALCDKEQGYKTQRSVLGFYFHNIIGLNFINIHRLKLQLDFEKQGNSLLQKYVK